MHKMIINLVGLNVLTNLSTTSSRETKAPESFINHDLGEAPVNYLYLNECLIEERRQLTQFRRWKGTDCLVVVSGLPLHASFPLPRWYDVFYMS